MICQGKKELRKERSIALAWYMKTAEPKWLKRAISADLALHTMLLTESKN